MYKMLILKISNIYKITKSEKMFFGEYFMLVLYVFFLFSNNNKITKIYFAKKNVS